MAYRIITLILLLCSTSATAGLFDAPGRSNFVPADQAFAFDFQQQQHDVNLSWQIKDGYYLYRSTVKKEVAGIIVEEETITESYPNESDNSTFRLETKAPFTVSVTPAVSSFMNGLKFDLTLNEKDNTVTIGTVSGFPEVVADGENVYNKKTRDFVLNYKYTENGTVYHVSQELIFRNRMVDGINQTREYLSYFN